MTTRLAVRCECSPTLFAFFKGTASEFNKLGPLAPSLMAAAAQMRNSISPYIVRPCQPCEGKGYINVANGPEDFDKEPCIACNGTGRVIANEKEI